ncbi:Pkinase-domain-containing protein [Tilletiaria anomala UBC 951]|uniref:Pkinase-domain-containing protein n=1 Tax=Tilletiaria anomala (strain ATCC 24038 / CBS 436.72 / UBC 951) TaxID=1037660 RepID=A0A066WBQ1_TILAU|nr:Pkinase-domain-containing protein [Tilletiaria anomala UBC 951]KDN48524.1 Pkinase-domain-containing protein [Tilletiaria anomala UBC 951]
MTTTTTKTPPPILLRRINSPPKPQASAAPTAEATGRDEMAITNGHHKQDLGLESDVWPGLPIALSDRLSERVTSSMYRGAIRSSSTIRGTREAAKHELVPFERRRFEGCSSLDSYEISTTLGEGTFGVVLMAKHRVTGQAVALKKITVHDSRDGLALTTIREVKLLKHLRHPAIVPVIDMVFAPPDSGQSATGDIYMVEPYMDHDLAGLLDAYSLSIPQIKLYMKQLLEGTCYMHSNGVLHRDMKSANLLISNEGQLQIADFGLARSIHNCDLMQGADGQPQKMDYTGTVVTRWYRPPELLAGLRQYGPEVDMWGLGCILAEMFYKKPFFMGASEVHQLELIAEVCGSPNERTLPGWFKLAGVRNADAQGRVDESGPDGRRDFGSQPRKLKRWLTTEGPVHIPEGAADLVDKLLVLNPADRLNAAQALHHNWLWSEPYPADPSSLPKYEPRKESDKKRREQERLQQLPKHPPVMYLLPDGPGNPGGSWRNAQPSNLKPRALAYPNARPAPQPSGTSQQISNLKL